jgi:outer membrane lipoprotein carrier protein
MKMRALILATVVSMSVLCGVTPISQVAAQSSAFECLAGKKISDSQGRALLDKVQTRYASLAVMHGSFRQDSFVAALEQSESSVGEVWFAKPGRMRWEYTRPQPQTVIIKGEELWLYQPDKRQVLVDDIQQVLLSALPVAFMMGVGNLTRDFEFKGACQSEAGVVVTLEPRKNDDNKGNSSEGLEGFLLLVDPSRNIPIGAKITSLGGNVTAIVFSNLSTDSAGVTPRTFVLEYPKGVDVVDRRTPRQGGSSETE